MNALKIPVIGVLLGMFCISQAAAQEGALTTLILVRHAEKQDDGTKDPSLTQVGQARAERLASMLASTQVDAIYSTNYKRTRETAGPFSTLKQLPVQSYEPLNRDALDTVLRLNKGKTLLMIGHSNTIPWTVNHLLGNGTYQNLADDDYNDMIIITVSEGKAAKLVWLSY